MANGLERHLQRREDIFLMGRELGRRSRSRCELCGERTSLEIVEVPPLPEDPDPDHALMVCARCRTLVEGGKRKGGAEELRFLCEAIWSELAPVQIVAVRAMRRLSDEGVDWAARALEDLYLDEAIEARL